MINRDTTADLQQDKRHILVVDDDLATRTVLAESLSRAGYGVQLASDGEEALGLLRQAEYDLILTDFRMPRLNGFELLLAVEDWWPSLRIIVVSGDPPDDNILRAFPSAHAWIRKPYDSGKLLATVSEAVQLSRENVHMTQHRR